MTFLLQSILPFENGYFLFYIVMLMDNFFASLANANFMTDFRCDTEI
jgi:hypothetical protein